MASSFFDIEPLDCGETCQGRTMDACSLCGKRLTGNLDIFMYRGDTPFCSEECRRRQMESDDASGARRRNRAFIKTEHAAAAEPARVQIAANVPVAI